jgi:predicted DNA-binding transcriptional regulator YafY
MSNLHRIQWIDAMIRAGRTPNCRTIADKFEISTRQASRDIEYLRDSLGAPLAYDAAENGYRYTDTTFVLPAFLLSAQERQALAYLTYRYARFDDPLAQRLAALFARVSGEARNPEEQVAVPLVGVDAPTAAAFAPLREAIAARRKVRLAYADYSGQRTVRVFCPYKLYTRGEVGYVVGFCELRGELRVLRLSRVQQAQVLDEGFVVVPYFDPAAYDEHTPIITTDPYLATVRFAHPLNLDALRLRVEELERGLYRIAFRQPESLLSGLLALAQPFAIEHPRWLRERLRARLQALFARQEGGKG